MEKWSRSVAVVTEANTDGLEILKILAASGVTVIGFDTKTENIDKFKSENESLKVYSVVCDTADEDETEIAFQWVKDTFSGVDILITNAGSEAKESKLFEGRVRSAVRCGKIALKSMMSRGYHSCIINILPKSSLSAKFFEELEQMQTNKVRIETVEVDEESTKKVAETVIDLLKTAFWFELLECLD